MDLVLIVIALCGGILAAVLYEYLFMRGAPEPVDHGTVRPA